MPKPLKFTSKPAKPLRLRQAKAMMELKELSLIEVAKRAGVSYTTAAQILNGHWISALNLSRLLKVIEDAQMPAEVHA